VSLATIGLTQVSWKQPSCRTLEPQDLLLHYNCNTALSLQHHRCQLHYALLTLIQALVVSKVAYCNSGLAGMSDTRFAVCTKCRCSTGFLSQKVRTQHSGTLWTHWLRVPERIKFRLCVLAFQYLHGTAPWYLAETLQLKTSCSSRTLATHRHWSFLPCDDKPLEIAFPVAAVYAWNSLPSSVRDTVTGSLSTAAKTVLFKTSCCEPNRCQHMTAYHLLGGPAMFFITMPPKILSFLIIN